MIEQKLVVGRYIELNTPPPAFVGPAVADFREVTRVVVHIDESESRWAPVAAMRAMAGFNPSVAQEAAIGLQRAWPHMQSPFERQRTSTTGAGQVAKAHRNFLWLKQNRSSLPQGGQMA